MNIKQIAKAAGVSVATVSRVLNHPEKVAPATREKIQKVIEEEEYKPNWFAQGLNFDMTRTIGIIIPHILKPMYMEIAKGVEDVARQKGYVTFVCNAEKDPQTEIEYVQQLFNRRVDGVILMFTSLEEKYIKMLEDEQIPVVIIGEHKATSLGSTVKVDCRKGAAEMTSHLIEIGHRSIAMLYGSDPEYEARDMMQGYKNVMKASGVSVNENLILNVQNTVDGGYIGAKKLLAQAGAFGEDEQGGMPDFSAPVKTRALPDAIFATSDEIAYGAIEAIKDAGFRVPDDIAVAGFGNDRMSSLIEPKLSTVELPFHKMGIYGARILFDLIDEIESEQPTKGARHIKLQSKLKIRKSCGHNERIGEMF